MSDPEHARLMLLLAKKDMKALGSMIDEKSFDLEIFGFHAQQAVEKSLKSWLSFRGIEYPKTHDLKFLFILLRQNGESIPGKFRDLEDLTDFAVVFRYEAVEESKKILDRSETIGQTNELINYVEDLIA